ncbi:signal peptidase complex catalytic subunit SEC11C-like isoform X2 [Haliotis rubra]|uniref:signal peptidase complex catalytic subunit SEC11C-like isoform X2 n=1 Tax=Haliotis rubra TaxID=36100 RepID=UPI001EE55710|nr:signal peptidase complex catalytic subunit SEC11C-like isoform X2 [Haliotis rubra]
MQVRQVYYRVLKLLLFMLTPVMLWVGLMVLTNCNMPVLVVTSGDLYPSFLNRGDVLFLTNYKEEPIRVGEIVVFKVEGRDIPIVHRVLKVHEKENGTVKILTKGDNNIVDDRGLYPPGKFWLERRDIVGVVKGYVSYLGIAAIILQENRMVKYGLLAWVGVSLWT